MNERGQGYPPPRRLIPFSPFLRASGCKLMFSDSELLERVLAGDRTAWQEWEGRFRPVLAGIARRDFRLPWEDIEDLLQDLAVALLNDGGRQLRAYRHEGSLRSWLCAVWRHRCLDLKRRRFPSGGPMLEPPQPGFSLSPRHSIEVRLLAGQALRLVGERDRILLRLHFIQGWSQREIAGSLGISENTVASSLARAKVRVRKILEGPARKMPDKREPSDLPPNKARALAG
jgi:RNA polymerase sigma factor (sigma-70 family)